MRTFNFVQSRYHLPLAMNNGEKNAREKICAQILPFASALSSVLASLFSRVSFSCFLVLYKSKMMKSTKTSTKTDSRQVFKLFFNKNCESGNVNASKFTKTVGVYIKTIVKKNPRI